MATLTRSVTVQSNQEAVQHIFDSNIKTLIHTTNDSEQHIIKPTYRPTSTWWIKPSSEWSWWEWICSWDIGHADVYKVRIGKEVFGPILHHSVIRENIFILSNAVVPIILQWLWIVAFPSKNWHAIVVYIIYIFFFIIFTIRAVRRFHHYMFHYGTFNQAKRGCDRASDKDVTKLGRGILYYFLLRTLGSVMLGKRGVENNKIISQITPLFFIKLGVWQIALDFFFYIYHRSCHEIPLLWKVHRQHHATKAPTPVLSILADSYQEVIEIILVPLLATLIVPFDMSFHELYLTQCYTIYVEMLGHSGIRADWPHPILGMLLRPFDMDLTVEDHDLHHRYGKGSPSEGLSGNYGKQTRIFDKLFGTTTPRLESK